MSNLRPRRGKQMPMIPPQVAADTDDSESEESVASVASIRSGSDLEEATFAEGDEEVAGAAVATEEMEVGQPDDGSDEEEEDEDDSEEDDDAYQAPAPPVAAKGGRRSTSRPQVTYNDGVSDDDEEVEDLRPPPTPGITLERRRDAERENTPLNLTDPRDYGKIYSELIDTCNCKHVVAIFLLCNHIEKLCAQRQAPNNFAFDFCLWILNSIGDGRRTWRELSGSYDKKYSNRPFLIWAPD